MSILPDEYERAIAISRADGEDKKKMDNYIESRNRTIIRKLDDLETEVKRAALDGVEGYLYEMPYSLTGASSMRYGKHSVAMYKNLDLLKDFLKREKKFLIVIMYTEKTYSRDEATICWGSKAEDMVKKGKRYYTISNSELLKGVVDTVPELETPTKLDVKEPKKGFFSFVGEAWNKLVESQ